MNNLDISIPFLIQKLSFIGRYKDDDLAIYYNNIERVLKEWKLPYKIRTISQEVRRLDRFESGISQYNHKGIILGYHNVNVNASPNIWCLKRGYLPLYMNFDRFGYSGWSEMAKSQSLFDLTQKMDQDEAAEYVDTFLKNYLQSNVYWKHKSIASNFKNLNSIKPFNHNKPYLFVGCQLPNDMVSRLSRIKTYELALLVAKELSSKIDIIIKLHPKDNNGDEIKHLEKIPNVQFSDASIHELIPNSEGVITVNSGVGFEALLYRKHVFTAGEVDYHWVTNTLDNIESIKDIISKIKTQPDTNAINKFLFYMMTKHFAKADDIISIKDHIQQAIKFYKENP